MNLKESDISEILEPLHYCLAEVIAREAQNKGQSIKYTDSDVAAATLMYAHILSNRYTHYLTEKNSPVDIAKDSTTNYAAFIKEITQSMTGVDTSKFLKGR